MKEIWRDVLGWEDSYQVSNFGRVRSKPRLCKTTLGFRQHPGAMVKPLVKSNKYLVVNMTLAGKRKQETVHRLVLEAFVGPCSIGMEACHGNGQRDDNRLENLRWDTRAANHADKKLHGTWQAGERNPVARLTQDAVMEIRQSSLTLEELSKKFGVSRGCVEKAKYGSTWKHLSSEND